MTDQDELTINKYDILFESRLIKVETLVDDLDKDIKEIKSDLRWLLKLLISFSTTILIVMAKGFHWY